MIRQTFRFVLHFLYCLVTRRCQYCFGNFQSCDIFITVLWQMASCTLDASVRIWGARVDSVHADTYSTLSLLHQTNQSGKKDKSTQHGEQGDGEDGEERTVKKTVIEKGGFVFIRKRVCVID